VEVVSDHTSNNATTVDLVCLFTDALRLRDGGGLHAGGARIANGDRDWQVACFHVETDADVHADLWEMHPASAEAVCCVRGAVRVYLRPMDFAAADVLVTVRAGEAAIIPRATWHRLELDEPSDIMSIAKRHGTRMIRRVVGSHDDGIDLQPRHGRYRRRSTRAGGSRDAPHRAIRRNQPSMSPVAA
jgi:mannose-6-phosphate isomerase-like protein (cupin superfamily)